MRNISSSYYLFKPDCNFSNQWGGAETSGESAPEFSPAELKIRDQLSHCQESKTYILIEKFKPKDADAILAHLVSRKDNIFTFQPILDKSYLDKISTQPIEIDFNDPLQYRLMDSLEDDADDDDDDENLPEFHNIIDILPSQITVQINDETSSQKLDEMVSQPISRNWIPTYQEYFDTLITIYGEKYPRYSKEKLAKKTKQLIQLIDEKDFHFLHGTPFQRSRNLNSLQFTHLAPITFETETIYTSTADIPRTQTQNLGVDTDPADGLGLYEFYHLIDYYSTAYSKLGKIPPKCSNSIVPKKEVFSGDSNEKKWKANVMIPYQKLLSLQNNNNYETDTSQKLVYDIDNVEDDFEVYPSLNSHYIPTKILDSPPEISIPYAREGSHQRYSFQYFEYPDSNKKLWEGLPYSSYQYENTCVPIFSLRLNSDTFDDYRLERLVSSEVEKKEGEWNYQATPVPIERPQRRLINSPFYLPFDRVDKSQIRGIVCSGTSHRMEQVYRQKLKQGEKRHPESWIPVGKEYSQSIRLPTESHQLYGGEKATIVGYSAAEKITYPYHDSLTIYRDISNTRFAKYTIPTTNSLSLSFIIDNDYHVSSKNWKPSYFEGDTVQQLDSSEHEKKLQSIHDGVFQKEKERILKMTNINNENTLRQYLSKYYEDQTSISQEQRQQLYQLYIDDIKQEEAQLTGIRQLLEQPILQDKINRAWKAISKHSSMDHYQIEYLLDDIPRQVLYRLIQKLGIGHIFSSPQGVPVIAISKPYHLYSKKSTRKKTRQIEKLVAILLQKYLKTREENHHRPVLHSSCLRNIEDREGLSKENVEAITEMSNAYQVSNPVVIPNLNINDIYNNLQFNFWYSFLDFHTSDKGDLFYTVLQQRHYQQQNEMFSELAKSYIPSGENIQGYLESLQLKYNDRIKQFNEAEKKQKQNPMCKRLFITKIYDSLEELEGDNCVVPLYLDIELDTLVQDYRVIRNIYYNFNSQEHTTMEEYLKAGFALHNPLLLQEILERRFKPAYDLLWDKKREQFRLLSDKEILKNKDRIRGEVQDGDYAVLYQDMEEMIYKRQKTVWVKQDGVSLRNNQSEESLVGAVSKQQCTRLDKYSRILYLQRKKIRNVEAVRDTKLFLDMSEASIQKTLHHRVHQYHQTRYYYESQKNKYLDFLQNTVGTEPIDTHIRRHPKQKLWEYAKGISDRDERYRTLGKIIQNEGLIPSSSEDTSIYWKSDPSLKMCCQHYLDLVKLADQPMEIKKRIYQEIDARWIDHTDTDGEMCCKFCGEAIRTSNTIDGVEFDDDGNVVQGSEELESIDQQRRATLTRVEEQIYRSHLSYILSSLSVIPIIETPSIKQMIETAMTRLERELPSQDKLFQEYLRIGSNVSKKSSIKYPLFYSKNGKDLVSTVSENIEFDIGKDFKGRQISMSPKSSRILKEGHLNTAVLQKIFKTYSKFKDKQTGESNFISKEVIQKLKNRVIKGAKNLVIKKYKKEHLKKQLEDLFEIERLRLFQEFIQDSYRTSRIVFLKIFLITELLIYLILVTPKRAVRGFRHRFDFLPDYTVERYRKQKTHSLASLEKTWFGDSLTQAISEIVKTFDFFKREGSDFVMPSEDTLFKMMSDDFMKNLASESHSNAIEHKLIYNSKVRLTDEGSQENKMKQEFRLNPILRDDHPLNNLNQILSTEDDSFIDKTSTTQTQTYSALPYSVKETATGRQELISKTHSLYSYYYSDYFTIDQGDEMDPQDESLSIQSLHQQIRGYFEKYCFTRANMGKQRIFSEYIFPKFAIQGSMDSNCADFEVDELKKRIKSLIDARTLDEPVLPEFSVLTEYTTEQRVDTIIQGIVRYFKYSEKDYFNHLSRNEGLSSGAIQKKLDSLRRGITVDIVSGKFSLELDEEASMLLKKLENRAKSMIVLQQMKTMFCRNLTIRDSNHIVDRILVKKDNPSDTTFLRADMFHFIAHEFSEIDVDALLKEDTRQQYLDVQIEKKKQQLFSDGPNRKFRSLYFTQVKHMVKERKKEIVLGLERVWTNLFIDTPLTNSISSQGDMLIEVYFKMYRFILENAPLENKETYTFIETLMGSMVNHGSIEFIYALFEYIILMLLEKSTQVGLISDSLLRKISILKCSNEDIQEQITQTRYDRDRLNKMRAQVFGDQLKIYREFNLGNFLQIQDGLANESAQTEQFEPEINGGIDRSGGEELTLDEEYQRRVEDEEGAIGYTQVPGEYEDE